MSKDRFIILRSYLDSRSTANVSLFEVAPFGEDHSVDPPE